MKHPTALLAAFLACCTLLPAFARGNRETPVTGLVGTIPDRPWPAADFALVDQRGAGFRMADMRGRVVVLTFIYTHCADVCPFISLTMKSAHSLLGSDAREVAFVAVTTDPQRDSPQVTAAYSKAIGLNDVWYFLTGPLERLRKVWADYAIGVEVDPGTPPVEHSNAVADDAPPKGLSKTDTDLASQIIRQFGGGYEVAHSLPYLIIDSSGTIRAILGPDAAAADIVTDVRILLKRM
jgi:cytochrome oxidase Cu insertion factor (SCO1/SenC/PrrC family)